MQFRTSLLLLFVLTHVRTNSAKTDRPIIGILAQETDHTTFSKQFGPSQILASYVKYIEMAGARVVPLKIEQTKDYYENLLLELNGVLLPGGGSRIRNTTYGYGRSVKIIYNLAKRLNKDGVHFPLWGTCLGMEALVFNSVGEHFPFQKCQARDQAAPILLADGYRQSRLFGTLQEFIKEKMEKENSTTNYHIQCLTRKKFNDAGLGDTWKILATSKDLKNLTYISVIEDKKYPFFGVQFHPEKAIFEWANVRNHRNTPHSLSAVRVAQYLANHFVEECRQNSQSFRGGKEEEDQYLIYNCNPLWMDKKVNKRLTVVQSYFIATDKSSKFCIHEN